MTFGCRVDSECGPGGLCSASPGSGYGVQGFYCHTADTCLTDCDCGGSACNPLVCAYQSSLGHWACQALAPNSCNPPCCYGA